MSAPQLVMVVRYVRGLGRLGIRRGWPTMRKLVGLGLLFLAIASLTIAAYLFWS